MARMPVHPAYAAHAPEIPDKLLPERANVAGALYRAALGPVNVGRYLAAFERLDAVGRVLPGWNWAAALCTPGWLVFRRLWVAALVYLLLLVAGAGLLWGLALPLPMLAGLGFAFALVACVVPGLYGDALLHADTRQRIRQAVAAAATLREAMALLGRQAPGKRRLVWVAVAGVALLCVLAGAVAVWTGLGARPPAAVAVAPASGQTLTAPEALAPVAQRDVPIAPPDPVPPEGLADAASAMPESAGPRRRLYVNVGLFADPANARRVQARLRQAQLPSSVDERVVADGRRLRRVRVGPFDSAAQANAAVAQVRALGLDAAAAVE